MKKFLKEKRATDLMTKKVYSVKINTPVKKIVELFAETGVVSVPVVDKDRKVKGIIRARDLDLRFEEFNPPISINLLGSILYLDDLAGFQREMKKKFGMLASDIMIKKVRTMPQEATLHQLLRTMEKHGIYRLPIVNKKGQLVGMVTNTDIIRELIKEGKNV
ncbi:MAG TPA: CBS domain-containing protein [Candidatus Gracilibacteria bacterium]|nr:CBS domain-containing protein [Candidatus Gracilibacteria bacterium]